MEVPEPEHLQRHKMVFDRFMAGETFVEISRDLGISTSRVWKMSRHWMLHVNRYNRQQRAHDYSI
jgi:hypothetical protein